MNKKIVLIILISISLLTAGCKNNQIKQVSTGKSINIKSSTNIIKPSGTSIEVKQDSTVNNPKDKTTLNTSNTGNSTVGNITKKTKYNEDLCTDNEGVLYSFKVENSSKVLSVCVSKTQPDYIVYRFGTKDNIELEYPSNKTNSWNRFVYSYFLSGSGQADDGKDFNYLTFRNNNHVYTVYEEYVEKDNVTHAGVIITTDNTNKVTNIQYSPNSSKGSLVSLRDNKKIRTGDSSH